MQSMGTWEEGLLAHPIELGRNTIKRILSANGIQPASIRRKGMSWETFLKSHWIFIAANDSFRIEVRTSVDLIRYFVLFIIDLKTRQIKIAGTNPQPNDRWMDVSGRSKPD